MGLDVGSTEGGGQQPCSFQAEIPAPTKHIEQEHRCGGGTKIHYTIFQDVFIADIPSDATEYLCGNM
jgi:hypothetical protein